MRKQISVFTILIHLAGWLLFSIFPILFISAQSSLSGWDILTSTNYAVFILVYMSLFYLNTYVLLPKLFTKEKYLRYTLIAILLLSIVCYVKPFDHLNALGRKGNPNMLMTDRPFPPPPAQVEGQPMPPPPFDGRGNRPPDQLPPGRPIHFDIISLFLAMMVLAISISIHFTSRWRKSMQQAAQAEADKANAELSFLKAQINPHFLFNTLNNIYSLAISGKKETADSIMKLSQIMRYVTDDAAADFVPMENEITCITDYIDLQRLRIGQSAYINYTVTGSPIGRKIAPLIFMTFIENLFKYGISKREKSTVTIRIFIDEYSVTLFCQNKLFPHRQDSDGTGIGINNTIKRLNHLYAGKYKLHIDKENSMFTVELRLET